MIRFHIGSRWESSPPGANQSVPTWSGAKGPPARGAEARGSLGIEVDGVDISGGRLEDRLFPTVTALVEGTARLVEGTARTAAVPFGEGAIELILARQGDTVALSLVSLPRPARVLVRDLEVDLEALARSAAECGAELLAGIGDEGGDGAARRLDLACRRLARATARPGAPLPPAGMPLSLRSRPPAGGSEAPSIGFDLRDDDGRVGNYETGDGLHPLLAPGHVYLHAPDGEELCAVSGSPFLLLRDLADVGLRLLEASREGDEDAFLFPLGWEAPPVEVDLRGNAVTVAGRTLRCAPPALARSLFTAALDLGGALLARNPRLAQNPWLQSLLEESRERLALCDQLAGPATAREPVDARAPQPRLTPEEPPLAQGTLRRVSLRVAWRMQVGSIRRLHPAGPQLWAIGRREAAILGPQLAGGGAADGSQKPALAVARATGGPQQAGRASQLIAGAVASAGPKAPLLVAQGDGGLACFERDGSLRWSVAAGIDTLGPAYVQAGGSAASRRASGLVPGRAPGPASAEPIASRTPIGDRAALIANGTSLRLIDLASGAGIFTLDPPAAGSICMAAAGALVAAGADNGMLYGVDAASATIAWRVPVGGPIVRLAVLRDRILVQAGGALACFAAATGEEIFRCPLPLDPIAELLPVPGGWVLAGASRAGGELLCIGAGGAVKWRARPNLGAAPPSLLRAGGALYARGESGVCRIERGKVRWNVPCAAGGAPLLLRGLLALPGETLVLIDAATGRALPITGNLVDLPPADQVIGTPDGLVVADRQGAIAGVRLAGALAVVR